MSEIHHYSEESSVTISSTATGASEPGKPGEPGRGASPADPTGPTGPSGPGQASMQWRPGKAGDSERTLMGNGTGTGWFLYFFGRYLILEMWLAGDWIATRYLDCSPLLLVQDANYHVAGMGYSLDDDLVSIGCSSFNLAGKQVGLVQKDFQIPGIGSRFAQPPELHLGAVPVETSSGKITRAINASFRPVDGVVNSDEYLSKGSLSLLTSQAISEAKERP